MSARLLTVLILPTLLLAVAPKTSRAAQQPAELAKTEKHGKAGKARMVLKVYQVTDLVMPIPGGPETPPAANAAWTVAGVHDAYSPVAAYWRARGKLCKDAACSPACTRSPENELIQLIQTTISPASWNDAGGRATLEYFPLTHSLVVNATPVVHEQIAELFEVMRRWLDIEVTCELRFLEVSDCVYDRLKADFGLKDVKDGPMASFEDKQVYNLLEAAQGDRRTHVMQAPKITMFDGQAATIRVGEDRQFTTGVTLRWSEAGLMPSPQNETIPIGFRIDLQPAISADHRTVDLKFNFQQVNLENPAPALVPTIVLLKPDPATGQMVGSLKVFPAGAEKHPKFPCEDREIQGEKDNPRAVTFTQFIQAPKISKVSLERKLVLPEGKTAVLYGWKQSAEVTDAVPVLSKLPFIGKHYQKVRQEPETVLVLVTPRLVVPEETEPEVLPMPRPLHAKKVFKHVGGAEEQETPPRVDDLLAKYHAACAAGKPEAARKIAVKALKIDPTCFDRKH